MTISRKAKLIAGGTLSAVLLFAAGAATAPKPEPTIITKTVTVQATAAPAADRSECLALIKTVFEGEAVVNLFAGNVAEDYSSYPNQTLEQFGSRVEARIGGLSDQDLADIDAATGAIPKVEAACS